MYRHLEPWFHRVMSAECSRHMSGETENMITYSMKEHKKDTADNEKKADRHLIFKKCHRTNILDGITVKFQHWGPGRADKCHLY